MNHQHLQLAYLATWIILIAYVAFLAVRTRALKKEFEELERGKK